MSDIVERLRDPHWVESGTFKTLRSSTAVEVMAEAADEIERLRSALELIVDGLPTMDGRRQLDPARFAAGVLERGE